MKPLTKRGILDPRPPRDETMIELRGVDGRLCGRYDPRTMRLEIKPKHGQPATFDLKTITPRDEPTS